MAVFYISNGLGESIQSPSPDEMKTFLFAVDASDEEHGAAWIETDDGTGLEWNGDGRLVFSMGREAVGHLHGVSRERALDLWRMLAAGDLAGVEREAWKPGTGNVLTPEREAENRAWQLQPDRAFYDVLGAERPDRPCRHPGCSRGSVEFSVFCRSHHFESIRGRPSPFDD